jgi:dienelactone hydrolase
MIVLAVSVTATPAAGPFRTHNDRLTPRVYASADEWQRRAAYLREHVLASAGLLPMPVKSPLQAQIFDERRHDRYSVFKVYFESLPGFYVTGNLYKPHGAGPFPTVLTPHGHWTYGRLENTLTSSIPAGAISLAEQGFVAFSFDMIGYNDSRQLTHDFTGKRENLWGLSVAGLQLWNAIRTVDFLESLSYVDRNRIGATGASGGGTQTFLLAAVDDRIKVAAPVNMISLHMQGGCICENQPGLRLDTNNVELAATIAPRPLLMVSATGDWTNETPKLEFPAIQRLYGFANAEDRVHMVQFDAPHNFNRDSREAVYAWMARWLKKAPADVKVAEQSFEIETPPNALVFYGRPLPAGAVTRAQLTDSWIASAKEQLKSTDRKMLQASLLHALALERVTASAPARRKTIVLAGDDGNLHAALTRAGFVVRRVTETPFDAEAAAQIQHFETYNRTLASLRVADIVRALEESPGSTLVASGDNALAGILALAIAPAYRAILDVGEFDTSSDAAFVEHLYIPGLRRAGDLQTAIQMTTANVVIHNAGERFNLQGPKVERRKLAVGDILAAAKDTKPTFFVSSRMRRR